MKKSLENAVVCIIGLGYVGLPLAEAFSRRLKVIGLDNDVKKIKRLTGEYPASRASATGMSFTSNPQEIAQADFIIICVPTPLTSRKTPDLSYIESAAAMTGRNMKRGSVVILESTVYPGVTEDIVQPILEKESGLECGQDFKVGYSPERINPGDAEHSVEKVTKVVAGMDEQTAGRIAALYRQITTDVFIAKDIRTAEASKVVENVQRDLNIALMNELAVIFGKMGINTRDVLDAASTKWNFHRYSPGLVGGYCIPVVPYYLIHKAGQVGHQARIVLAARHASEYMPQYIAGITLKALENVGKALKGSKVLIMGLSYKENVPDTRESPVKGIIEELKKSGMKVYGFDPLAHSNKDLAGIVSVKTLEETPEVDAIIIAVSHDAFKGIKLSTLKKITNEKPVLIDVKRIYRRAEAERAGFTYLTL